MKRFRISNDGDYIIDELTGFQYNKLSEFIDLLNSESERANRIYEYFMDSFRSDYEKYCRCLDTLNHLQNKLESEMREFIQENWNKELDAYVDVKSMGCVEITVFDKYLDVGRFKQFIIDPLCEKYKMTVWGLESYESVDGDNDYFEWHLGEDNE